MKNIIYIFLIFSFVFSCSNDDNDNSNKPCVLYRVFISDNCDCNDMDFNCGDLKFISEEEFIRLKNIQESSTEQCIYIQSKESATGSNFEGYIIALEKSTCNFDINI